MRHAIVKPDIPAQLFPAQKNPNGTNVRQQNGPARKKSGPRPNSKRKASDAGFDEFGDATIDDADMILAETGGFQDIDDLDDTPGAVEKGGKKPKQAKAATDAQPIERAEPRQLENGKWACNHNCKDKEKH